MGLLDLVSFKYSGPVLRHHLPPLANLILSLILHPQATAPLSESTSIWILWEILLLETASHFLLLKGVRVGESIKNVLFHYVCHGQRFSIQASQKKRQAISRQQDTVLPL